MRVPHYYRGIIGASDTDTKIQSSGETCDRLGLPKDAGDWSVDQVQTWAKDQGFDSGTLGKMRELEVDGDVLLHIEPADIQEDLGVSSGIQAKKLFLRIKALHEHNIPMGVEPLSFWQHRAMNRKAMDTMVLTIGVAPRTAMTYFKMFPKAAQPAEPIGGWLEWLFVPEYYIWRNADTIVGGLPGFVPACLLVSLVGKSRARVGFLASDWQYDGCRAGFYDVGLDARGWRLGLCQRSLLPDVSDHSLVHM